MSDQNSEQWEKKSERFEVRLPHSKKIAFQEACDRQGDTPSEAIRRSIEGYLYRSEIDAFQHAVRLGSRILRQNWRSTLAAFLIGFPISFYLASSH